MNGIIDNEKNIIIENKMASYDEKKDYFTYNLSSITSSRKNGFLVYDINKRNIGIVFMSDDKRTARCGNSEILFYKKYKQELGTWRIIKINNQYLSYEHLEKTLKEKGQYKCKIDSRHR